MRRVLPVLRARSAGTKPRGRVDTQGPPGHADCPEGGSGRKPGRLIDLAGAFLLSAGALAADPLADRPPCYVESSKSMLRI